MIHLPVGQIFFAIVAAYDWELIGYH